VGRSVRLEDLISKEDVSEKISATHRMAGSHPMGAEQRLRSKGNNEGIKEVFKGL